ncbi:AAA family ATPase [Candidatus Pacearchaeota archaeon]|nr:AAA family ATPase [Candidatus Pacearchaeota archaeon]
MGKIISILSLKGGVGKTSTVTALGDALSKFGKKVLLVDGNLSAPNLGLHLNVIDPEKTLHHVLRGEINPKDAVHKLENFDIIPSSLHNKSQVNPLKLKDKLKGLKRKYDLIIIDSPPSLNEESRGVMNAADNIFIVTTPDYPTMSTTLKTAKMIKQRGAPLTGLIINKVYKKNFELSANDIEKTTEIPVMAVLPHDINVPKAQSKFKTHAQHNPKSEVTDEINRLAASLLGKKHKPIKMKRMFRWIKPKRQDINRTIFYESLFE